MRNKRSGCSTNSNTNAVRCERNDTSYSKMRCLAQLTQWQRTSQGGYVTFKLILKIKSLLFQNSQKQRRPLRACFSERVFIRSARLRGQRHKVTPRAPPVTHTREGYKKSKRAETESYTDDNPVHLSQQEQLLRKKGKNKTTQMQRKQAIETPMFFCFFKSRFVQSLQERNS